ncbi:conserved hypothetical protein [Sphingomonas sp. EC-HK361]|uniref:hypothetical protein n=1 Tax=Sphingomonas sp. EC-HK361 TaxID=2038397 RepID=UPI001258A1EC|nr:hypothetical protein [Sphingomonas sp. EC-HK361]VVT03554.1 conserved hypothetical protein [Sphingomonas sp. EC-HK361]
MLGFGRKRTESRARIAAIQADGRRVRAHLAAQLLFATDHLQLAARQLWTDAYSRGYVFGAFDALLSDLPPEHRDDATTANLIQTGFVSFSTNAFAIGEREATEALADLRRRQLAAPLRHAIADGRSDGLQMRQGMPAMLWLAHLVSISKVHPAIPTRAT